MMPLDSREILARVRLTVRDVHDGLLQWIERTLSLAGLEGVQTASDFPPDGRTAPTLVVFPYRFGPDPNLHNTARGCSLLGLGPDYRPGATGLPEPWSQMGALLTDALLGVWPGVGVGRTPGTPLATPRPVQALPEPLQSWYRAAPEVWRLTQGSNELCRLPSLWYVPGLSVTVSYLVSASAASRGALPTDVESTPLLLSALSAVVSAIHHENGFDLAIRPQIADRLLPGFVRSVSETVLAAAGPPDLAQALEDAADSLTQCQIMHVQVLLTQELATGELFTLMQALQRPFKATFCLRVSIRLADLLLFGPASEGTPRLERFVYAPPDDPEAPQAPGITVRERSRG